MAEDLGRPMKAADDLVEDLFGDPITSPATAKAPESESHPTQTPGPKSISSLEEVRDVISRLRYFDADRMAEELIGIATDNGFSSPFEELVTSELARILALWAG